jgi:hypothetical protein
MSTTVKFSSKLEESVLQDLKDYAAESSTDIYVILNKAVEEYLAKVRVRPVFMNAAASVIDENEELLQRLAK